MDPHERTTRLANVPKVAFVAVEPLVAERRDLAVHGPGEPRIGRRFGEDGEVQRMVAAVVAAGRTGGAPQHAPPRVLARRDEVVGEHPFHEDPVNADRGAGGQRLRERPPATGAAEFRVVAPLPPQRVEVQRHPEAFEFGGLEPANVAAVEAPLHVATLPLVHRAERVAVQLHDMDSAAPGWISDGRPDRPRPVGGQQGIQLVEAAVEAQLGGQRGVGRRAMPPPAHSAGGDRVPATTLPQLAERIAGGRQRGRGRARRSGKHCRAHRIARGAS